MVLEKPALYKVLIACLHFYRASVSSLFFMILKMHEYHIKMTIPEAVIAILIAYFMLLLALVIVYFYETDNLLAKLVSGLFAAGTLYCLDELLQIWGCLLHEMGFATLYIAMNNELIVVLGVMAVDTIIKLFKKDLLASIIVSWLLVLSLIFGYILIYYPILIVYHAIFLLTIAFIMLLVYYFSEIKPNTKKLSFWSNCFEREYWTDEYFSMIVTLIQHQLRRKGALTNLMNTKSVFWYKIVRQLVRLLERPVMFIKNTTRIYLSTLLISVRGAFSEKSDGFVRILSFTILIAVISIVIVTLIMILL